MAWGKRIDTEGKPITVQQFNSALADLSDAFQRIASDIHHQAKRDGFDDPSFPQSLREAMGRMVNEKCDLAMDNVGVGKSPHRLPETASELREMIGDVFSKFGYVVETKIQDDGQKTYLKEHLSQVEAVYTAEGDSVLRSLESRLGTSGAVRN